MVAKIEVEVDDNTGKGFDSIAGNANTAAGAVDNLDQRLHTLEVDLHETHDAFQNAEAVIEEMADQLNQAEEEVRQLTGRLDAMAARMDEVQKSAKKTGTESQSAFGDKMVAGLAKGYAAVWAMKEVIGKVGQAITALSENGSPAFAELTQQAESLLGELTALGDDPAVQDMVMSLVDAIRDQLIPLLKSLPDGIRGFQDTAADTFAWLGEQIGVFEAGTLETLQEMQIEEAKILAKRKEKVAEQRVEVAFTERLQKLNEKIATEVNNSAIQELKDIAEVNGLLADQAALLEEMAKDATATKESRDKAWANYEAIEKQKQKLIKETGQLEKDMAKEVANQQINISADHAQHMVTERQTEAQAKADALAKEMDDKIAQGKKISGAEKELYKKAADEVLQLKIESFKKEADRKKSLAKDALEKLKIDNETERQIIDETYKHKDSLRQKDLDAKKAASDKELEIEKAAIEARKQLLGDGGDKNVAKALLANQTPEALRKRLADTRGAKAGKEYDDMLSPQDREKANSDPRERASQAAERAKAVADAKKRAFNDFNRGKVDPEEMNKARQDNANAVIDQAKSQGKLNETSAKALGQMTEKLVDNSNEINKVNEDVKNLSKQLAALNGFDARQRGQMGASKP